MNCMTKMARKNLARTIAALQQNYLFVVHIFEGRQIYFKWIPIALRKDFCSRFDKRGENNSCINFFKVDPTVRASPDTPFENFVFFFFFSFILLVCIFTPFFHYPSFLFCQIFRDFYMKAFKFRCFVASRKTCSFISSLSRFIFIGRYCPLVPFSLENCPSL